MVDIQMYEGIPAKSPSSLSINIVSNSFHQNRAFQTINIRVYYKILENASDDLFMTVFLYKPAVGKSCLLCPPTIYYKIKYQADTLFLAYREFLRWLHLAGLNAYARPPVFSPWMDTEDTISEIRHILEFIYRTESKRRARLVGKCAEHWRYVVASRRRLKAIAWETLYQSAMLPGTGALYHYYRRRWEAVVADKNRCGNIEVAKWTDSGI